MSDPADAPPPSPVHPPPRPPKGRGLGWFLAISGSVVLLLTLGCVAAVTDGDLFGPNGGLALVCGSPTLILGTLFLWLGARRLKR